MTVLVFLVIKIENLYVPQWYAEVQHQHNYPHRFCQLRYINMDNVVMIDAKPVG